MKKSLILCCGLALSSLTFLSPGARAQNSTRLFTPVNVRASQQGTTYANPNVFNSTTLNVTCSNSPITAVLSSTPDGTGNVLVDNNIQVAVGANAAEATPVNVCKGGTSDGTNENDCFTIAYQSPAGAGQLNGQDPDTFVSTGGVAPIDISGNLQAGTQQLQINLVDGGGFLASSTIYLDTNCTVSGATGPAGITGNPISQTNPTSQQLTQNFTFNATTNQNVQFVYDLSQAQAAGTLSITDGTIPGTEDAPIDPTTFQSVYVPNTSFATSNCLIHTGEALNNTNAPACKLFTLECTVGTGTNESGAQCPVSTQPNEIFQDIFDGPAFTLPDINTPSGTTFHEGVGFLMASEGWTGGPCTFDPASGLQNLPCPQNLLTSFSGPGLYIETGKTSHPNSTFIAVTGVPEDLTTVTVTNQQPGGWINSQTATLTLSSQPPNLTGTTVPNAANFVPAPIQSITYGISTPTNVPQPSAPASTDTTVANSVACPVPPDLTDPAATVFTTPQQTITVPADGNYLLHYYAQDCAGTQELQFTQDGSGSWSTSYYTVPVNVDTVKPAVASGPILSPAPGPSGAYGVNQTVTATYSCTDDRSGVVQCGASTFSPSSAVLNTGTLSSAVNTSSPGVQTYTVMVKDAAGNQSSATVNYTVQAYDSAVHLQLSQTTVVYPTGSNVVISVTGATGRAPTGTVQLFDGTTLLQTVSLRKNGAAYLRIQGLSAGTHQLSVVYSGDSSNPAGVSAPVTFTVNQVPVQLLVTCWNANFTYGANYNCKVNVSSTAGSPQGVITYQYDGNSAVNVPLQGGNASFVVSQPAVGSHTVVVAYPSQTNYAAAGPSTQQFTVTPTP